jgi:hypothetical protein
MSSNTPTASAGMLSAINEATVLITHIAAIAGEVVDRELYFRWPQDHRSERDDPVLFCIPAFEFQFTRLTNVLRLKLDKDSYYYTIFDRWIDSTSATNLEEVLPKWMDAERKFAAFVETAKMPAIHERLTFTDFRMILYRMKVRALARLLDHHKV